MYSLLVRILIFQRGPRGAFLGVREERNFLNPVTFEMAVLQSTLQ